MSAPEEPARPTRVRVSGPPRRRASGVRTAGASEIDAETALGEVFMRSLLRDQLRLAAGILTALFVSLGSLPALFHLAPELADVRVLGLPVPWLMLSVLVYPWLVLLGWVYVRRAEANERAFTALVTHESEGS